MTALPATTSTALVRAILDTLRAHPWPAPIATIGYRSPFDLGDPDEPSALVTPAILLNITSREPDPEAMTPPGRRARRCGFELHGVLSIGTPDLQTELLELADAITALLEAPDPAGRPERGQRWGLGQAVDLPTDILDADQSPYAASLNGFDGRVVTWTQTVYLPEGA
ncbi:MAG: hypothetical protein MZV65_28630 [Chromatiales bacterium]|nr:hypothetical protein [Chromatiales bacterium]